MFCFSIPAISRVPSVSSVQAAKLSRLVSRSGVKLGLQRAGREGAASHYTPNNWRKHHHRGRS